MSTTTQDARVWLSPDEAATVLGVTTKTLRTRIAAGELPAYRFGPRLVRIDRADLDALGDRVPANAESAADALAEHIARVVAAAPPLAAGQRDRLARLLRGGERG